VEWGKEAASRTMVAYGGAAPLHACALADKLKIDRVVVPTGAGVGSANGFLLAPVSYEVVRSRYQRLSAFDPEAANAVMQEMYDEAATVVRGAAAGGNWREARRAFMRYQGQGYEIAVPLPTATLTADDADALREAFDTEYQRLYGRLIPNLDVEVLSWTLTLIGSEPEPPQPVSAPEAQAAEAARFGELFDAAARGFERAGIYRRADLRPGHRLAGPALVVEAQTTTVVGPQFELGVDARGYLVLERTARAGDQT